MAYLDIHKDFLYADASTYAASSDVSWLASLYSLEYLDMSSVNLSAAVGWVHAVNKLPNLRALYLSNCGLRVPLVELKLVVDSQKSQKPNQKELL
ncbi:Cf2/Cf5-like disease resistance protein [Panicum miliaceum]|uniref:Cf2/Cf5-like disease resistance protein n=1 Tax=Panicum miliaceum TaxID=4540 RepID=A0A3L6R7G7_PANMI|nr:Cf2/Cf5-like disease resistance protein [Panicum miliaceum]